MQINSYLWPLAEGTPARKCKKNALSSLNRTIGLWPKVGCASTMKTKYFVFCFALSSAFTTFGLRPKIGCASTMKTKYLVFCFALSSAFTTFAHPFPLRGKRSGPMTN